MRIAHSLRKSAKSSLYIRARLHAGEEIEKKCFRPKLPAFRTFRKRLGRQRDLESARENISRSCCRAIIGELLHETLSREKWAACASISSYFFFFFFYFFCSTAFRPGDVISRTASSSGSSSRGTDTAAAITKIDFIHFRERAAVSPTRSV